MEQFISSKREIDLEIRVKRVLGKKVLGKNGDVLGRVFDVVIKGIQIYGIIVKKGFLKFYVDSSYVEDLYADSVLLKIDPLVRLLGMRVFDSDGMKLGKVVGINRKTESNILMSLSVKKNIFSRPFIIHSGDVDVMDKNVILNKVYE